jgi:hypothetical protein
MMDWLKGHVYVATWLGLVVTVVLTFLKAKQTHFVQIDWFRFLLYFSFFTCLAVVFTPTFDQPARDYARYLSYSLLGVIIVSRKQD